MSIQTVWHGHTFTIHPHSAAWNNIGGIYIFCGVSPQNHWIPLYIGKTNSLSTRIPQHEMWSQAQRLGASHVHARVVPLASVRAVLEETLIRIYQPRLNTQHAR